MSPGVAIGRVTAALLGIGAVLFGGWGALTLLSVTADPDGFLAEVAALFGVFLLAVAIALAVAAYGVVAGARWASGAVALACGLLLTSGVFGLGASGPPGTTRILELGLTVGGVVLLVLLVARLLARDSGDRPKP